MKRGLKQQLNSLTDIEFIELKKSIELADWLRSMKRKYQLTDERISEELTIADEYIPSLLSGAYQWDLMMIAKLEAFNQRLIQESIDTEIVKVKTD
jgi:hypothetical protein